MIQEVFKNSPWIRRYRVMKSRCQSGSTASESAPRARRGRPAQAARTVWWLYANAGLTGQADVGNKVTQRRCPPSLARIRAPLPHLTSLSRHARAKPPRTAPSPPSSRATIVAPFPDGSPHRSAISPTTLLTTHHLSPSQGKRLRASPPSPYPRRSAAELALAVAVLH